MTARQPRAPSTTGRQPQPRSRSWTRAAAQGTSSSRCSGCSGGCAPRKRACRRQMRRTPSFATTCTDWNSIRAAPRSPPSTSRSKRGSRAGSATSPRRRSLARVCRSEAPERSGRRYAGGDDELAKVLGTSSLALPQRRHAWVAHCRRGRTNVDDALFGRDMSIGCDLGSGSAALAKVLQHEKRDSDSSWSRGRRRRSCRWAACSVSTPSSRPIRRTCSADHGHDVLRVHRRLIPAERRRTSRPRSSSAVSRSLEGGGPSPSSRRRTG